MACRKFRLVMMSACLLGVPSVAKAGMPSPHLTEIASMRIETLSFFLLGLFVSALAVKVLWNLLARDFARLPRLSYGRSLAMVVLWGLMFTVVLTMIAGARELLTPGAWEKHDRTYRLADGTAPVVADEPLGRREHQIQRLKSALWEYALAHDGQFPDSLTDPALSRSDCEVPGAPGMRYGYVAGRIPNGSRAILAHEPDIFGDQRFVLYADGQTDTMRSDDLRRNLESEEF